MVHDNVAIDGGTGDNIAESVASGGIRLQDHGDAGENPVSATCGSNPSPDLT